MYKLSVYTPKPNRNNNIIIETGSGLASAVRVFLEKRDYSRSWFFTEQKEFATFFDLFEKKIKFVFCLSISKKYA